MAIDLPGAASTTQGKGFIYANGQEVGCTVQCCHCGCHWLYVKGSGKWRGFCMNCGAITCGRKKCRECTPWLKKLEMHRADPKRHPLD